MWPQNDRSVSLRGVIRPTRWSRLWRLWPLSGWLLLTGLGASRLSALERAQNLDHFAHTSWGAKQGAPSPVKALAQTRDGYLWVGTPDGLYRFDGVTFEHYEPPSSQFPAQNVNSLLSLPTGELWIGF